jgi:spore germination protein YaaH
MFIGEVYIMINGKCKFFILLFSVVLITGIILPTFAGTEGTYVSDAPVLDKQSWYRELLKIDDDHYYFKDIEKYWAKASLYEMSYMDIIKGYGDKTIRPDLPISREEFVSMLVRAIGMPVSDDFEQSYRDVYANNWSHKYITAAKDGGLLNIYNGFYFYPYKNISREEMAVITSNAVKGMPLTGEKRTFKDIPKYYVHKESIDRVTSLGIIMGLPDGSFDPKGNATRAQAAVVIERVLRLRDSSNGLSDEIIKDMALQYEKKQIEALSEGDFALEASLAFSTGKERRLNEKRAEALKIQYLNGSINKKYIKNEKAVLLNKSHYLAEVELFYDLLIGTSSLNSDIYSVKKKLYLKKMGDSWAVYNMQPGYEYEESTENGDKINLTWHYIWQNTPDMSKAGKKEGLNIISPTWFTLVNEHGDVKDKASLAYTNWAHKNGYKVWALVDNEFDPAQTSKVLNNPQARAKLITGIIENAKKYKVDGINIDFENMYIRDKDAFTQFMKELSVKTKQNKLILSVDVSVIVLNSNWSGCYDRAALSKVVDYVALMAYDQYWEGSPVSGSVAQLSWVEENLKKVLKEVPNDKLLLGVPFYTRLWKEEYRNGSSKPVVTSKAISMAEGERIVAENKGVKIWDAASGQYYATYKKDNATYKIWLEDERSIALKSQLVTKYNLAGIASWKYGLEKPVIWKTIANVINN